MEPNARSDAGDATGTRRWPWVVCGGLLVVFGLVAWDVHFPRQFIPSDDALYILLSRSIRQLGYRETWVVGAPVHAHYPPGYPLTLAMVGALFGESWTAFVTLNAIFAAGSLALLFDAARRIWNPLVAAGILLVSVLNTEFALWTTQFVIAEAQYTFLATLGLWLLLVRPEPSRLVLAACGSAVVLAALTRPVGVAVVAALGLVLLIERRWKVLAVFGAVVIVTVGAWMAWSAVGEPPVVGTSYATDLTEAVRGEGRSLLVRLGRRAMGNTVTYVASALPVSLSLPTLEGTIVDNALWTALLVGFTGAGVIVLLRRWRGAALYALAYAGILMVWPWAVPRFLVPVLPLAILLLVGGGWEVLRRSVPRYAPQLLTALVLILAAGAGTALARRADCDDVDPSGSDCQPENRLEYAEVARFVRDSLGAPGAVVAARPHAFALQSGRSVVPTHLLAETPAEQIPDRMRELGAGFVVLSTVHAADSFLALVLTEPCSQFEVERRYSSTTLLLELGAWGGDAPGACEAMKEYWAARDATGYRDRPARGVDILRLIF